MELRQSIQAKWIVFLVASFGPGVVARAVEPRELVGIWKNEIQDQTGRWDTLSWYRVGLSGGRIIMSGIDYSVVAEGVSIPAAFGDIGIGRDGWEFSADVDGRHYQFALRRVTATHYEGVYSVNRQRQGPRRRLIKIVDNRQLRSELDLLLARHAIARTTTEQLIELSRQNRRHWEEQGRRERERLVMQPDGSVVSIPTGNTGALQSIFQIQATGKLAGDTIRLQTILQRIRAATEVRQRL